MAQGNIRDTEDPKIQHITIEADKPDAKKYYTFSGLAFSILFMGLLVAHSVFDEKVNGTITGIQLSRTGTGVMIFSKGLTGTFCSCVQILSAFAFSSLILGVKWGSGMINVIRNTFCIFKRNKEYIYLITIQPLLIFLLISVLLPYTKTHNVAVADLSGDAAVVRSLSEIEGIKAITVSEDEITEKLIGGSAELAVIVNTDNTVQIIGFGKSEIEDAVSLCIENALSE